MPTKKSARVLRFKNTQEFVPVKITWKDEGETGPCWWVSAYWRDSTGPATESQEGRSSALVPAGSRQGTRREVGLIG